MDTPLSPVFAIPEPAPERYASPPETETDSPSQPETPEALEKGWASSLFSKRDSQKPAPADATPTPTSSRRSGDLVSAADAATLIAGVVGAVALGISWAIRARTRGQAKLREPNRGQAADIAQPLARIAARHVPAELLNPDLADAISAMNATGAYVSAGPLIVPRTDVDNGVPEDLQEQL